MALLEQTIRHRHAARMVGHFLAVMIIASAGLSSICQAQTLEYKFQAIYFYNFLKYTEWPTDRFPTPDTPIVIGVLGKNPFGTALAEAVGNEKIHGRRVVVQYFRTPGEIQLCHALYISQSEEKNLRVILPPLTQASILTVSDAKGFTGMGGHIRFFFAEGKLRFEVNREELKKSRLRLSSQLLKLAKMNNPGGKDF